MSLVESDLPHPLQRYAPVGMQACPSCGAQAEEAGRFCPDCGAVLAAPGRDISALANTALLPAPPSADVTEDKPASLVGHRVADIEIEGVIGSGSFGTVYRGRQRGLDRPVAVKVPTYEIAADPIQARRFAREARAAARIVHPGVVAIYAVGELEDGRPYLAMQLIDGVPLDRILEDGPIAPARALTIARSIASALSETHAAGVVHRDLKPSNVMWRRDRNGDDRITIVDFGIALGRPGNADATRLTSGGLIGTPHYMSPEQAHGEDVDARTDLYSLGCLLFELVTGEPPFDGSGFEVLLAHLQKPAPRASARNAGVPAVVDELIAQLMAKRADDRPATADALIVQLDDALASLRPRRARTATASPSGRRWPWLAAGVAALATVGTAAFLMLREPAIEEPASTEPTRVIARDDGELIIRTRVPDVIRAGVPMRGHIAITNKLGGAFDAKQVVITVEDPQHNASAQTAALEGKQPGQYVFRHRCAAPGTYVVRIFPSEAQTVSTIELEVR